MEGQPLHHVWEPPPPSSSKKAHLSSLLSLVSSEKLFYFLSSKCVTMFKSHLPLKKPFLLKPYLVTACFLTFRQASWEKFPLTAPVLTIHLFLKALKVNVRHSCIGILTSKLVGIFFFCWIQWVFFNLFLLTFPQHRMLSQYFPSLGFQDFTSSQSSFTSLSSLLRPLAPPCLLSSLKYWCSLGLCSCAFFLILHFI